MNFNTIKTRTLFLLYILICLALFSSQNNISHLSASENYQIISIEVDPTCLLSWSPDGTYLASVDCGSSFIHIWDTATWEQRTTIGVEEAQLTAIDWHPDGQLIASASQNKQVRVWNIDTGENVHTVDLYTRTEKERFEGGELPTIDWHPDGVTLAMAHDFDLQLWNVETDTLMTVQLSTGDSENGLGVVGTQWNNSGEFLAIAYTEGYFSILSQIILQPLFQTMPEFPAVSFPDVKPISWESNSRRVAMIRNYLAYYTGVASNDIQIYDTQSGDLLAELVGHEEYINAVSWSYDGQWIASSSGTVQDNPTDDDSIRIWATDTYIETYILTDHEGPVKDIGWSPTKNILASASLDGTIRIWEIPSNE